jgi:hypothetical protein
MNVVPKHRVKQLIGWGQQQQAVVVLAARPQQPQLSQRHLRQEGLESRAGRHPHRPLIANPWEEAPVCPEARRCGGWWRRQQLINQQHFFVSQLQACRLGAGLLEGSPLQERSQWSDEDPEREMGGLGG